MPVILCLLNWREEVFSREDAPEKLLLFQCAVLDLHHIGSTEGNLVRQSVGKK